MIDMIRTFHAIGQGAFYTEEFSIDGKDEFTVVYDCGTYSGKKLVTDAIDSLGKNRVINILFISHFHQDHINCLEYLLKNCDVKNIFIPLLHDEEKILVSLTCKSKFHKSLVIDPTNTIRSIKRSSNTNIIFIAPDASEPNNNQLDIDNLQNNTTISGGTPISNKKYNWVYLPFNFSYKSRSQLLIKKLKKIINPFTADNFRNFYLSSAANKNLVETIYLKSILGKQIPGGENTNSLVVYSGSADDSSFLRLLGQLFRTDMVYTYDNRVGCIYMGDYDSHGSKKYNEFEVAFYRYLPKVSTIQIPHHGSKHNYCDDLLNFADGIYSVISARKDNIHHPAPSVVKSILVNKGIPILVTEESDTTFTQHIYI